MSLASLASDMQTQAQAVLDALSADDTGALQTAYGALHDDVTAAQPLIASSITTGGLASANSTMQDLQTQLQTIYAVAYPFGTTATSDQIASAVTAAQNASRDALQLSTLVQSSAQNVLNSSGEQSQLSTQEQQANAGALAQAGAQQAAWTRSQAAAGRAAQNAAQVSAQLPPVTASPATASGSTGTVIAVVGGGLALGALAWWFL